MTDKQTVTVNRAVWDSERELASRPEIPDGWAIVNAPRPLLGRVTWTGEFRHGVFYAAGPAGDEALARSWRSDDAWPVEFIDDAEIERRVLAKFAEYGYESAEDAGVTIAEQAYCMGLPYGRRH